MITKAWEVKQCQEGNVTNITNILQLFIRKIPKIMIPHTQCENVSLIQIKDKCKIIIILNLDPQKNVALGGLLTP